jgi:transposase-like protein
VTQRAPLTRPDGTDPEGFSRRVAEAYNEAVQATPAPAPALAEEAGVPVVTVHRWIADARRRGALPPGRKGVAGHSTRLERTAAELGVTPEQLRQAVIRHANGRLEAR